MLVIAGAALPASADTTVETTDTISITIYFQKGNSQLKPEFEQNGVRLDEFVHRISALEADTAVRLSTIDIIAYTSPEGSYTYNKELAGKRAEIISDYLHASLPSLHESLFNVQPKGINWQGLINIVEASDMKYRDEVLDILHNVPEQTYSKGKLVDSRLKHLMDLRGGRPYRYMFSNIFPALRNTDISVICRLERHTTTGADVVPEVEQIETVTEEIVVETTEPTSVSALTDTEKKPFYMSLSTNMLYDALLVPNIGAEFYLGKDISITANWMYGWWSKNNKHRYWRIYGGDLAARWWFGSATKKKPLTGHHAGVYASAFIYDFEFGGRGQMAGKPGASLWQRAHYAAGLEYGYSLPVARHLNIDFTIGLGYMGGIYYDYRPQDGHYVWTKTSRRHWFGPTKLQISLVWLLGHGNINTSKGGGK